MIRFHKNILLHSLTLLALVLVLLSCTKDGNPNKLPTTLAESEYVGKTGDGIVRILAIGNSFSEDAIESHLYNLAKADGKKVIIGNMYIGGASLELHVQHATSNASIYEYRKIDTSGVKRNFSKTSIATALADEQWDYISFQQVSQNSGQYNTFEASLPTLYNYVKERAKNPNVKYLLHQTWAYAQSATHSGFVNYNNDQMTMYNAIVDAYTRAKNLVPGSTLIPAGTAIQNARTSLVGDNFTRDGYHLSIPFGRYTAASVWFEAIFGKSVVGNTYKPDELSTFEASISQNAAHFAIQKPNEVTQMVNYQGDGNFTGSIYLNFGTAPPPAGWNGLTSFMPGASVALKNNTNNYTGVGAVITERFNGANTSGEGTTITDWNMPTSISGSAFFGNSKTAFGGLLIVQSKIRITGLNKDKRYNFCYFGSRAGVTDNRETKFITTGANEVVVRQNTSSNKTAVSCAEGVQPDGNGEVMITVTAGENNNQSNGFYYINAMRITQAP